MLQDSGSRVSHLGPLSKAPCFGRVVSGPLNQKPLWMEGFLEGLGFRPITAWPYASSPRTILPMVVDR